MATKKTDYPAQIKALKEKIDAYQKIVDAQQKVLNEENKKFREADKVVHELGNDLLEAYSSLGDIYSRLALIAITFPQPVPSGGKKGNHESRTKANHAERADREGNWTSGSGKYSSYRTSRSCASPHQTWVSLTACVRSRCAVRTA